ncbi:HdeD family acid-resistance protein [Lacticaseibacillus zhaodongensis]|uniref:HdeD family acid-resistance protein n=1 Tax=Lacticaseibacillus zhaodongensis TaxID=2668065 RepID=UPI0012D2E84E|nr:DUF308 domain-containing protein [Lacticaseibacillus zhaodongensis]
MKSFYAEFQRSAWLRAILMFILGVWMAINPRMVFGLSVNIIAAVLLISGIMNLITGAKVRRAGGSNFGTGSGIALIVAALLVEVLSGAVLSMIPFLFGLGLIIYAISEISGARSSQYVNVSGTGTVIYGVLILVAGLVIMFNPFGTVMTMLRILGVILVVMAVMECVNYFRYRQ